MKRLIFSGGLSLALAVTAVAGPLTGYTNSGTFTSSSRSLVIDATNFVNLGTFDISVSGFTLGQFDFSDVLTYTNRNVMFCDNGFLFNDSPTTSGSIVPSVNFVNQNPGQIYGGAALPQSGNLQLLGSGLSPRIIISATNITSSGILQVGQAGEIQATGDSMNLSHGASIVEGLDQVASGAITGGAVLGPGEFIQYWGTGLDSNNFFVFNLALAGPTTAPSTITNNTLTAISNFNFNVQNATAVAITNIVSPSNIITQVILVGDSLGIVTPYPFFVPITTEISTNGYQEAVVEWSVQLTNVAGGVVSNTLFLTDDLGGLPQLSEVINNTTAGGINLLVPTNYTLLPSFRGVIPTNYMGNVPYSMNLFSNGFGTNGNGIGQITNQYATFEVNLSPVTFQPDSTPGSTFSNVAGRIEITANQTLDLTSSIINAGNYLNLSSPNDYRGSQGAQVVFPFADINLGSTNGQMSISNLVAPYLTRWNGPIQVWSAAWTNLTPATNIVMTSTSTNTNAFMVTNGFHVLMVSSALSPTSPVNVENFSLRSTNVVISDIVAVNQSLLINAQSLTITSNDPAALTPTGELGFFPLQPDDVFSANLPGMMNFTNFGIFETENAAFFQIRQDPDNPTAGDGPWQSVVNAGTIFSGGGDIFWVSNFQNTGFIESSAGPVFVQASTALVTNSAMAAFDGDMSLTSGSLTISNVTLQASGFLDLGASTLLTDLTAPGNNKAGFPINTFSAGDGFSLLTAPATGGLLGTQITSQCRTNAQCENFWAGLPVTLSGALPPTNALPIMANNVPLGQLVLDGGNNKSIYHFEGANFDTITPYAMYVDQISLLDGATNLSPGTSNGFTAFKIDTNVTIFFLDAVAGPTNQDISATLNGAAGGHLVWVSNYVGHFSAFNVTYTNNLAFPNISNPQGQTFAVNRGYVAAYGLPPVPLTPQTIALVIGTTNVNSTPEAAISWYAPAYSTNTLYSRTFSNTSWLVRTNFVQGASSGRVNFLDSMATNHLYKVGVSPSQ